MTSGLAWQPAIRGDRPAGGPRQSRPREEGRRPPARIVSLDFWAAYAITMRPYLLFVSGMTGLAGAALAPEIPLADLALLFVLFLLSYGLGQALTDCFQTDTDSLSSPYRPLVQGRISSRDVMAVSVAGLAGGGAILALYNPLNVLLVALGIAGLATYTPFKRRWWGGPIYNAWIVVVLCLIGYTSALGAGGTAFSWSPQLLSTLVCVLLGYANFVLVGYFKDISADRATGYQTLPVAFGLRTSSLVSDVLALFTVLTTAVALYFTLARTQVGVDHIPSIVFAVAGTAIAVFAQAKLHRVRSETEAHRAVSPALHSFLLLLSAVVTAGQPNLAPAVVLLHAGFLATMAWRPVKEQI